MKNIPKSIVVRLLLYFIRATAINLFVLFSVVLPINSQTNSNDTTPSYKLDEFKIIYKKDVSEIIPPQKLSGLILEKLNSQSVADAVRFFAGVQVKDYGGIGGLKTINIRSMGTNQMGVFYDNIQVGNAQNGQIDLGRFSLDNIESISIYNGQKSSLLQSAKDYGSAGTVYIKSRTPYFEESKPYNVITRFKTGSFGLVNPSVLWQQRLSSNISLSISTEFMAANGRYKFTRYDTTLIRQNSDIKALRTEGSILGKMKNGEWNVKIYNYNSSRGLAGYIARNLFSHKDRQWDNNFFLQSSILQYLGKYSYMINLKYANDYLHYISPDTITMFVDNIYRQQELYLSMANSYKFNRYFNLSLSADYQYNYMYSDMLLFAFPSRNSLFVAMAGNLHVGRVKLQSSLLVNYVAERLIKGVAAPDKLAFSPSVVVSYSPFESFPIMFRSFLKRSFRMPTFNDLYYTTLIAGASKLKPEYVNQLDIGMEYNLPRQMNFLKNINVSLDAYYNEVRDKIVAVPTSSAFRWQMYNLGIVKILGIDFSFNSEFRITKTLSMNVLANYSYQNARNFTDRRSIIYKNFIPYTPQHSFTTAFNIIFYDFHFNYCVIYTGERYNASANIPENYVLPWYTHDISMGYKFNLKKMGIIKLNLDINNLFNQQYDVVLNYPMPGTNLKISGCWEI